MKQLERILRIVSSITSDCCLSFSLTSKWVHGGLIRGMTKEVRKKKESMMPLGIRHISCNPVFDPLILLIEELDPRLADDSGHNRADRESINIL